MSASPSSAGQRRRRARRMVQTGPPPRSAVERPVRAGRIAVHDLDDPRPARSRLTCFRATPPPWWPPDVDLVVELIGGLDPAGTRCNGAPCREAGGLGQQGAACLARRGVPTSRWPAIRSASTSTSRRRWQARSRCSRPLRESLAGEGITRVMGIVNGTTNYILSRMGERGRLRRRPGGGSGAGPRRARSDRRRGGLRRRGQGGDPGRPGLRLRGVARRHREGITASRVVDVAFARRLGFAVKLLAIAERLDEDEISVRVYPAMVP